jgi:23S rRNA (cytosine1962-C5)-methyltransferase
MKTIRLRAGKEKSLLRRHPWVFDGAVARGGADAGETVRVESHEGQFLAWAAFSPHSRIRARVWSFEQAERIDAAFFAGRIAAALKARSLFDICSDGVRLIHGESDGLPGLVVDRYGDTLVAQFTSCGTERWKSVLCQALLDQTGLQHF